MDELDADHQPGRDVQQPREYPREPSPGLILAKLRWQVALDYAYGWRNEQRARRGVL